MSRSLTHSLFLLLVACLAVPKKAENDLTNFSEKHRPQYHFSPPSQWMNDPNGMFYYQGEYHLFYQYYPDDNVWGPMHWGHAVSPDMVEWEHLPIALYPDSLGYIFSGSAVVDWNNTSGLGTQETPPIVAIYTYHDPVGEKAGRIDFQTQGIAYSLDKGRTWLKYKSNPVLPNPGIRDFRDPKVIWHEPSNRWVMALAVWDHVSFYSSPDLKTWKKESDFGINWGSHAGVWECPDLFPLKVEGTEELKWVLLVSINPGGPQGGSATQYFIGEFDGSSFSLDEDFKNELGSLPAIDPVGDLFEDFENGYKNWNVSGSAFGSEPSQGTLKNQNPVEGYKGNRLVNSYLGGDATVGELISNEFTITKNYINLLVGGGNDNLKTYVALAINGQDVRRTSGRNGEKLDLKSWNVTEYIGQKAQIKIVDNHVGGWGHINVDHISFADEPAMPATEKAKWLDYGADNYAGVTWSDVPYVDGRRLFIGWMSNWQYANIVPTFKWRSAMTLPRNLLLTRSDITYRIKSEPVLELTSIIGDAVDVKDLKDSTYLVNSRVHGDFSIRFENDLGENASIKLEDQTLSIDRRASGITEFHPVFPAIHSASVAEIQIEKISIYIDLSSIEVFINDGELVMTDLIFPNKPFQTIITSGNVSSTTIFPIKSIWR